MKIQCDVCGGDEASVFCCADEAVLCDACDRSIHHANKVASKHRRFSISSAAQTQPLCDICKERRGFVFCQEDRAILCNDCDDPIHSANQLTMKHSRFLLTGARLSAMPLSSSTTPPNRAAQGSGNNVSRSSGKSKETLGENNQSKPMVAEESPSPAISRPTIPSVPSTESSNSISEYLTKTIPGYRVEDLLVDDANDGVYKNHMMMPSLAPDHAVAEDFPIWAADVPQIQSFKLLPAATNGFIHCDYSLWAKEMNQKQQYQGLKVSTESWSDDSFMVPQINTPVSSSNKRLRPSASSAWGF